MVLRSLALALALTDPRPSDHLALARFEEAAAAIEATMPTKPGAEDLEQLRLAATIRVGLGQQSLAEADLAAIERALPPHAAAAAFWERRALLHTHAERVEHAQIYLRRHARAGGREREALAALTLATHAYREACHKGLLADACLSIQLRWYRRSDENMLPWSQRNARVWPIYAHCRGRPFRSFMVYPRNSKLLAQTRVHVQRARRAVRGLTALPASRPSAELVQAGIAAELFILDPSLEAHLATIPPEIRLVPDRWRSGREPEDWRRTERKQLAEVARTRDLLPAFLTHLDRDAAALHARYVELATQAGAGTLARAAWLRAAFVAHHQAAALLYWEPVGGFASRDDARAHCEAAEARIEAPLRLAREAYARCLADAHATGHIDHTAELCESILGELWPADYPERAELLDLRPRTTSRPITIGVQEDPPEL